MVSLIWPDVSTTLLENMKICCNIQVKIYQFLLYHRLGPLKIASGNYNTSFAIIQELHVDPPHLSDVLLSTTLSKVFNSPGRN